MKKAPLFKSACPWPGRPTASRLVTIAAAAAANDAAAAAIDAAAVYRLGPFLAARRPAGRQLLPFAGPGPNKKAFNSCRIDSIPFKLTARTRKASSWSESVTQNLKA